MEKPKNINEYITWWNKNHKPRINDYIRRQYQTAAIGVRYNFENSEAWNSFVREMYNFDAEYRQKSGYELLITEPIKVKLIPKEWPNFISKVWRKNVVNNENWENEPSGGWISPDNWYEQINDIVRTTIVVKYLDGVKFLLDKACPIFAGKGYQCKIDWEAREEGYYAAHLYVYGEYELLIGLHTEKKIVRVEIQINTQIADVIKALTHKYYEERRIRIEEPGEKWQWNYKSDEFAPNYVGHILHYVDGVIMEIRDRKTK